jgi:hypothetical protein
MSRFIHETFDSPVGPARPHRAQITWPEGTVCQIIAQRANPLGSNRVPMVGTGDGETIERNTSGILEHEFRIDGGRGPASCRMMFHRGHLPAVSKGHAQSLRRGRSRAIEAHVVGSRADHLHRLADRLGSERSRHSVIAIKATTESATKQIAAQHDLVLAAAQGLGQHWQDRCLPLISRVDLEDAILFKSQGVDWLQREMHHGAGCVGSLEFLLCRAESRVHAWVVDDQGASVRICDQFGRAPLQVLLGYVSCFA